MSNPTKQSNPPASKGSAVPNWWVIGIILALALSLGAVLVVAIIGFFIFSRPAELSFSSPPEAVPSVTPITAQMAPTNNPTASLPPSVAIPTPPTAAEVAARTKIVYVKTDSRAGGEYDLYLISPDGGQSSQLTSLPGLETSPTWSPDGQRIAFVATQDSQQPGDCATGYVELRCNFDIYSIRIDGSDLKRLTTLPTYDRGPAWSPDGNYIAFSSRETGARSGYIYLMAADGTGLAPLTTGPVRDTGPTWSPDGQRLAFTRETCCESESSIDIYVIGVDGANLSRLTDNGALNANPAWSPDGQAIAWMTLEGEGESAAGRLAIMNADGTGQTMLQVGASVSIAYPPSWSPDSQQLVFISQDGNRLNLYRVNRDGTNLTRVSDDSAFFSAPAWSPILP